MSSKLYDVLDYYKTKINSIIDAVYPVGSIYMSVNSVDPGSIFGGTWQRIENKFLLAAGAAGSTYYPGRSGGSATHTPGGSVSTTVQSHTLTVDEIPSHYHDSIKFTAGGEYYFGYGNAYKSVGQAEDVAIASSRAGLNYPFYTSYSGGGGGHGHGVSSSFTGSEQDTMPPYLAVYVWKRIS